MQTRSLRLTLAVLYLLSVCGALASFKFLQYRFAGYDLSPLIDGGWRILSGQTPNRDFICTFPPVLYLGVALGFRVFGVSWSALSITGAVLPLLLLAAGFRLLLKLRALLPEVEIAWLAFVYTALQLAPLLAEGHPWHSFWTECIALYALLGTFVLCRSAAQGKHSLEIAAHLAAAVALLLLAKPNVAMPILLTCLVALVVAGRLRSALLVLTGGVLLASLALAAVHTSLWTTFHIYGQLTGRFFPGLYLQYIAYDKNITVGLQRWTVYALLLPVAAWGCVQVLRPSSGLPLWLRVLALGAGATTFLGIGTNVDFSLVDAPCLVLAAGLVLALSASWETVGRIAVIGAAYTLLALGAYYGLSRTRMQQIGIWAQEPCGEMVHMHDPFFGHMQACRTLLSTLGEVDRTLAANPTQTVFFGPRLEFLYAREHLPSPRGLPLWWHPGSSYPLAATPAITAALDADRPERVILMHGDRDLLPAPVLAAFAKAYTQIPATLDPAFADLAGDRNAHVDIFQRNATR